MIRVVAGDNTFLMDERLRALVQTFEGDVEKFDGEEVELSQLPDLFTGVSLFSPTRLVVLKNISANKSVWSELVPWLEKASEADVVFVEDHPDKRTKTYKWLEKHADVTVCAPLRPNELVRWVEKITSEKSVSLAPGIAQKLVDYVGEDQWRLVTEVDKLAMSGRTVTPELIKELLEPAPHATVFELLDAVFRGDKKSIQQLVETLSLKEDPYMFFGLLASQVYALAVASASGTASSEVARAAGIHPFVLQKSLPLARSLSRDDVDTIVGRVAALDENLKSRPIAPWTQISAVLLGLSETRSAH